MLLRYNNLEIRNATVDDAEQLAAWWNDGNVTAHAGFPNGTGQTAKDIADSLKNDMDDFHRCLIIEVSQIPVGEMIYRNMGQGIAEIDTNMENKRAQHVYEELGELQSSIDYEMDPVKFINYAKKVKRKPSVFQK